MRLANTFFDPYIAILDSKRFELAASDDAPLLGQDAACSVIIPADGTYVVQVRDSAYGGNGACGYRLHVGTFPRPTGGGARRRQAGRGGRGPLPRRSGRRDASRRSSCRLRPEDKFGLFAQDAGGICPSPIPFRLSEFGNVARSRAERHAAAGDAGARVAGSASTASSTSRATSTTSASRRKRGRPSTSTATPGGSARRSIRS